MKHLFSPLLPKDALHGPVLVLAAHPDDEVIGAGSMLGWHGARGHDVTVVHATDGAKGDPGNRENDIRAVRRREGIEALARLGIREPRHWDLPDGELPEHLVGLIARLQSLFAEIKPKTLYSFWFAEAHRDHRALALAVAQASHALPDDVRCLLYGVNQVVPAGALFDVTAEYPRCYRALQAYASQNAYVDLPGMSEHRCRAATVNVDVPGVLYGELFVDLRKQDLVPACKLALDLQRLIVKEPG